MGAPHPQPDARSERARRQTNLVIQVMLITNALILFWVLFGR